MSNTNVLQVRADAKLIAQAQKQADMLGFSSLQEIVRLFLAHLAKGKIEARLVTTKKEHIPPEHIKLGQKASKRWARIIKEADRGKNMYYFDDANQALEFLLSEDR